MVTGQRLFDEAHHDRRRIYGSHVELVEKVADILDLPNKELVRSSSYTLCWRGVWSLASFKYLKRVLDVHDQVLSRE